MPGGRRCGSCARPGAITATTSALRARHDFIDLCKRPQLAVEVTLGPIEDFGFDAAILFSDLLFPLEAMGMGLRYEPGPKLDWHLRSTAATWRGCTAARRVPRT